ASAELYNPITERFALTGSMREPRWSHTATLLPNGKVLVAGGFGTFGPGNAQPVLTSAEVYDPAAGTWTSTPPMQTRRALHSAILLGNGKVLVAGGRTCDSPPPAACDFNFRTNTAELYDPATNTWSPTDDMVAPRHTTWAVMLENGRVLIPAGFSDPDPHNSDNTADVYNPATGTWSLAGNLNSRRARQGAMVLHDGRVLTGPGSQHFVFGPPVVAIVNTRGEVYDPAANTWTLTGLAVEPGRYNFWFTTLPNGKALVAGGNTRTGVPTTSSEVYDPATNTWASAGNMTRVHGATSALANSRQAVVLSASPTTFVFDPRVCGTNCGKVLVVGDNLTDGTADLYTPAPVSLQN
ncbi:MAG: hypothetical protein LC708_04170, partial [Actinobacteria bacterium]|nr:hypothetical protein [Actinomycetota bacterium]